MVGDFGRWISRPRNFNLDKTFSCNAFLYGRPVEPVCRTAVYSFLRDSVSLVRLQRQNNNCFFVWPLKKKLVIRASSLDVIEHLI